MHSIAWPITVTSTVLFSVFLWRDQVCATYFDFGWDQWRGVVVFVATYFPMFALLVDFTMNRLVLSYKHLIVNLIILGLYFFVAFVGSMIQDRPIYANHLPFKKNYGNNYDLSKELTGWGKEEREKCIDYFVWDPPRSEKFTIPNYQQLLWTTIGTAVGTLIVSHVILTAISKCRRTSYFNSDRKEAEKDSSKVHLLGQENKEQWWVFIYEAFFLSTRNYYSLQF